MDNELEERLALVPNEYLQNFSAKLFDRMCRVCLSCNEISSIFKGVYQHVNLTTIFQTCFSVQIKQNDGLPQNICKWCVSELTQMYAFKLRCQESDAILRFVLRNQEANSPQSTAKTETQTSNCEDNKNIVASDSKLNCDVQFNTDVYNEESDIKNLTSEIDIKQDESKHTDVTNNYNQNLKPAKRKKSQLIPPKSYSCRYCNESFDTFIKLREHLKQVKHVRFVCPICNKPNPSNYRLKIHMRCHTKSYSCRYCNESFDAFIKLREHLKQVKHVRFVCPICNKPNPSNYRLKIHMRCHTKEKPYRCEVCPEQFSIKSNLRRHNMRHTGERPYVCEICDKGFIQRMTMKAHLRHHTGEAVYDKRKRAELLKNGVIKKVIYRTRRPTIGETPFKCTVCHRFLSSKGILSNHMKSHGAKQFLCNYCGKCFSTNVILEIHMKLHTGDRPYKCSVCNKTFKQRPSLIVHSRIHTGKKPFTCNVCSRTFRQKSHLRYHMRTHTGERPYVCSLCNKTFALNGNLVIHKRTHTGETPYSCDVCNKGFYDSSNMKKHKRMHHNVENKSSGTNTNIKEEAN